jgi:shikimate dehydrogenase
MSISARPSHFGIRFHNFLYEELGLNYLYKSFAAPSREAFDDGIRAMKSLGIRGCGISMPYKEHALSFVDELTPAASHIGAINTLVNDQGRLTGWNTDSTAMRAMLSRIETPPQTTSVLLLGSGGMARAIAWALADLGFSKTVIASRNEETGAKLAQEFGLIWKHADLTQHADVLINATPIGMAPNFKESDPLPFIETQIQAATWVMDSVASPPETRLVRISKGLGKKTVSGFEITLLQAVEQFVLYTGVRPTPEQAQRAAAFAASA